MPTIFTHVVVPLALAAAVGRTRVSPRLVLAGAAFAILPDADVVGFSLGIEYGDAWGHRGASHSLLFAAACAGLVALIWGEARSVIGFLFLSVSMASHGLLDTLTNGGLGAALWWPFDEARIFAPVTPVRVSPIGAGFFSMRGLAVLWSEMRWIWLPCIVLATLAMGLRRIGLERAARSRL